MTEAKFPPLYQAALDAFKEYERAERTHVWESPEAELAFRRMQLADFDRLFKTVMTIKGRAIRQAGAMLREIKAQEQAAPRLTPEEFFEGMIAESKARNV